MVGSRYCAENRDKIWQFQQDAKQRDIRKLAAYAEKEEDERIFARILGDFFDWRAYPLKPDKILKLALSENKMHRKYAFEALRNLKDDRIHTVGVELLKNGDIENGLPLFCKNWQEGDDELIYLAIKAQPKIKLWMQARIAEVYTQHASPQSGKVLRYVYKKARCTSYRYKIVQAMEKNGVLTSVILQECLYDSYKETREWAKRVVTQRGVNMGDNV